MTLATLITGTFGSLCRRPARRVVSTPAYPDARAASPDIRRLIRDRRYCRVLTQPAGSPIDAASLQCAQRALQHDMALIPAGTVRLVSDLATDSGGVLELIPQIEDAVEVESVYLDRHCVTNADYARFVQAGGYTDANNWPEQLLPSVLQLTDQTGHPGPRSWRNGAPPADRLDHPVVGVCWHEANAYATWVGKRLPTTEQWQRAGTWSLGHEGDASEPRYPWGNVFQPSRANLWTSGHGTTCPVGAFAAGNTAGGVNQLIGNVWEWVDAQFFPAADSEVAVWLEKTMAEIRGGAFDTYFPTQAACQFRTGQPLLYRGDSVGFRCCLSADALSLTAPTDSFTSQAD